MIDRRKFSLWRLVRLSGRRFLVLLAYNVLVTAAFAFAGEPRLSVPDLSLPLLGSAVALVVSLRNNAAYARWWEARSLWGAVINNARSFARTMALFVPDAARRAELIRLQVAYAVALRCHLLQQDPWPALDGMLDEAALAAVRGRANVPVGIQSVIARRLAECGLDSSSLSAIDRTLSGLLNAQGGLERIKNTPMPRRYNQFPMLFVRAYCMLLPVGLLHSLGLATPIGATVVGFMFLALDRMGVDLEDPFEGTPHDVPMKALVRTIEIDLLQEIGAEAPQPVRPVDGVLW